MKEAVGEAVQSLTARCCSPGVTVAWALLSEAVWTREGHPKPLHYLRRRGGKPSGAPLPPAGVGWGRVWAGRACKEHWNKAFRHVLTVGAGAAPLLRWQWRRLPGPPLKGPGRSWVEGCQIMTQILVLDS